MLDMEKFHECTLQCIKASRNLRNFHFRKPHKRSSWISKFWEIEKDGESMALVQLRKIQKEKEFSNSLHIPVDATMAFSRFFLFSTIFTTNFHTLFYCCFSCLYSCPALLLFNFFSFLLAICTIISSKISFYRLKITWKLCNEWKDTQCELKSLRDSRATN